MNTNKQNEKLWIIIGLIVSLIGSVLFTTACFRTDDVISMENTPTATPLFLGTDENGNEIYATVPPQNNNDHPPVTPTPYPIGTDENGETIYATANPDYVVTHEPFSYEVTEPWIETKTSQGMMVTINMELHGLSWPMENYVTTAKIVPDEFDIDLVKSVANYFLDGEIYKNIETKDDIQKRIAYIEEMSQDKKLEGTQVMHYDSIHNLLEMSLKSAPDVNEEGVVEFPEGLGSKEIDVKAYEDGAVEKLFVRNQFNGAAILRYSKDMDDKMFVRLQEGIPDNEKAWEEFDTFYEPLKQVVEAICDMKMRPAYTAYGGIYPVWVGEDDAAMHEGEEAYAFYFTPVIDSKSLLYGIHAIGSQKFADLVPDFNPFLSEYVMVVVDRTGVRDFLWTDKVEIAEEFVIDQTPINLDTAVSIFKDNIFDADVFYEEGANGTTIYIREVDYGLVRLTNDDSTADVIPVYAFEGYQTLDMPDATNPIRYSEEGNVYFMLISAIDGSVVEFY